MSSSLIGRIAVIKGGCHFDGHWGVVLEANEADNEYLIGGGSISILNDDGTSSGSGPMLLREDFIVPRKLNTEYLAAIEAFKVFQKNKT
ncbi:hypothetical protein ABXZ88_003276 [Vibrio fluvialis]|uniref:hypothetical protein n=1 Tax=Vibrio fluvialis TaxID=676 RepID=UPI0023A9FA72|nr:hypothetical protein [Vibrio fluvialis]MDE5179112.1 hypothetical protein [Vibrio fluvialis]